MTHVLEAERNQMNRRTVERFAVAAMYSEVEASRMRGGVREVLGGHVYDVSESGVRIELDSPVMVGETLAIELRLPGEPHEVRVCGDVVWVNDDLDDPGPRRVAVRFDEFLTRFDRERLLRYLSYGCARRAA